MIRKSHRYLWFFAVSIMVCMVALLFKNEGTAQVKRDPQSAEEVEKVNVITPAAKATGTVLDNTVNKVLPFDISTESQLVRHEQDCYRACKQERDEGLAKGSSEVDRGEAWNTYQQCSQGCPVEAANKIEYQQKRVPAGSAIEHLKFR